MIVLITNWDAEQGTDMQKSQENGQKSANTDSARKRVHKSRGFKTKAKKSQPQSKPLEDKINVGHQRIKGIEIEILQEGMHQDKEGIQNFDLMAYTSQGSSSSNSELEEALKEKDDLKLKLEKLEESSKNLTKLIDSQISAKDKTGLGYDS
ncbi:hypothetical protein Tco_1549423 [Tanacetum coccineum]